MFNKAKFLNNNVSKSIDFIDILEFFFVKEKKKKEAEFMMRFYLVLFFKI